MASSSQVYPAMTGTIDPGQITTDATAGIIGTEWYPTTTYTYDPYIPPYSTPQVDNHPWGSQYARASVPDIHLPGYGAHSTQPQIQIPAAVTKDPHRPRSSPSTFGPTNDQQPLMWQPTGLGINYSAPGAQPTPPVTATFPPTVFQTYPPNENYSPSPGAIKQPQPVRPYTNIAPNPIKTNKRSLDSDDPQEGTPSQTKRRKRTASVASQDLSEDDRFLVQLKEEESLPWKDIANRFQTEKGKPFQVAALQMRYKRLREKFRIWDDQDVSALKLAHEYWEKYKWEIISAKMLDFGIQERWPARHCARKWQELEAATATHAVTAAHMTPVSISQYSSPVEGTVQFAFMPPQQ